MNSLTAAMGEHHCDAVVVTCMDFRFQAMLQDWLSKNLEVHSFDRVSIAGAAFDMFYVLKQIDVSVRLHHSTRVILVNHEECGAYGESGTRERLCADMLTLQEKILSLWPEMTVTQLLAKVSGEVEEIE